MSTSSLDGVSGRADGGADGKTRRALETENPQPLKPRNGPPGAQVAARWISASWTLEGDGVQPCECPVLGLSRPGSGQGDRLLLEPQAVTRATSRSSR